MKTTINIEIETDDFMTVYEDDDCKVKIDDFEETMHSELKKNIIHFFKSDLFEETFFEGSSECLLEDVEEFADYANFKVSIDNEEVLNIEKRKAVDLEEEPEDN